MQRRWANLSLGIALVAFLVALGLRQYPWAGYLEACALASVAGGIADWFAVTALFRHPLGLSWLPHTSIISKNRDRIIEAIAVMVEQELLSVTFIESNIERLDIVERLVQWLRAPRSAESQQWLQTMVLDGADWLTQSDEPVQWLHDWIEARAASWSVADVAVAIAKWLIQSDNDRAVFRFLSQQAIWVLNTIEFTDDMELRLKVMIENYTKTTSRKVLLGLLESLGTIDYKDLSHTVKTHLIQWLDSERAFEQFELALVRAMMMLRDDDAIRQQLEKAKMEVVSQIPWQRVVHYLVEQVRQAALNGRIQDTVGSWQVQLAQLLEADTGRRQQVEQWIKTAALGVVRRYHPVIGRLVRDNLHQMNERDWIDKLEWYVGRDLQWIRINGAIVGGIIGLALFLLAHLV